MLRTTKGFTIVELLIVIVVIAILAAITIVAYNGVQTRAKGSQASSALKSISKGMRLYAVDNSWSSWPLGNTIDPPATNPSFNRLLSNLPNLGNYISSTMQIDNSDITNITYSNSGTTKAACNGNYNGVNVIVLNVSQAVANSVDNIIDDGDNSCGLVRYDSGNSKLIYSLSYTTAI